MVVGSLSGSRLLLSLLFLCCTVRKYYTSSLNILCTYILTYINMRLHNSILGARLRQLFVFRREGVFRIPTKSPDGVHLGGASKLGRKPPKSVSQVASIRGMEVSGLQDLSGKRRHRPEQNKSRSRGHGSLNAPGRTDVTLTELHWIIQPQIPQHQPSGLSLSEHEGLRLRRVLSGKLCLGRAGNRNCVNLSFHPPNPPSTPNPPPLPPHPQKTNTTNGNKKSFEDHS